VAASNITYASTHGVFEAARVSLTDMQRQVELFAQGGAATQPPVLSEATS
jgi:hypothetical protein